MDYLTEFQRLTGLAEKKQPSGSEERTWFPPEKFTPPDDDASSEEWYKFMHSYPRPGMHSTEADWVALKKFEAPFEKKYDAALDREHKAREAAEREAERAFNQEWGPKFKEMLATLLEYEKAWKKRGSPGSDDITMYYGGSEAMGNLLPDLKDGLKLMVKYHPSGK